MEVPKCGLQEFLWTQAELIAAPIEREKLAVFIQFEMLLRDLECGLGAVRHNADLADQRPDRLRYLVVAQLGFKLQKPLLTGLLLPNPVPEFVIVAFEF